jgi:hypothetical protein
MPENKKPGADKTPGKGQELRECLKGTTKWDMSQVVSALLTWAKGGRR